MSHDYRPGDVLLLECPFTETAVTGVTRYYVSVRWPWLEVDAQAENIRWNGQRALPTPSDREWEIFRTEPAETALRSRIPTEHDRLISAGQAWSSSE